MDWVGSFNKMGPMNVPRKPIAEFDVAHPTQHYNEPPRRTKPGVPSYSFNEPPEDIVVRPRPRPTDELPIYDGWQKFPPPPVPRLDLDDFESATGKELRDVEEFTDQHIQRSVAVREAMEQAWTKAKEIEYERELNEDLNEERDMNGSGTFQQDQVLLTEMERIYDSFTSFEGCEEHAALRRRYSETLKNRSKLPAQTASKVKLLLGGDGKLPNDDLPQSSQLYFLGSPPKMYIIPFDKAVAAGLEDVNGSKRTTSSLPNSLQTQSPQSCLPSAPFLPGPPLSQPINENIPEWFSHLKIPVRGRGLQTRWANFLELFSTLDKGRKIEEKPKWDKVWHEPDPKWQFEFRRKSGGWWRCRSGPDAPKVEAECRPCRKASEPSTQSPSLEERYREIMDAINEAMGEVAEKDKAAALETLRHQHQEDKTTKYKLWLEDQQETRQKMPKKMAYHRTQGYSLLRGYEGPSY
ncbi:hypothetical protein ABKA04_009241 [Annulohypoxylon sp. FPYF3050]